ncbi:hypothetical protein WN943_001484 [Citrus x changshan-huyou]
MTHCHSHTRDGATEQSCMPSRVSKREEMMPVGDGDGSKTTGSGRHMSPNAMLNVLTRLSWLLAQQGGALPHLRRSSSSGSDLPVE